MRKNCAVKMPVSSRGSVNVTIFFLRRVIKLHAKMYGMYGHFDGFSLLFGHGLGWCHVIGPVCNNSFFVNTYQLGFNVR